ncbi:Hpt domain-containing protein [Pseudomonas sp. N040]|uniref:Hpt domain-containing protein n=1 Tax=Pseudomonas sp. N040 TaxID=2785325 RepID=UPI0018A2FCFD|nr:Hpt domain-containing protein [Pseudomonas sp. N040]MBF7729987.1 Hpt domain-containing protein [Pseudomonas sp. N040]MBW7013629.1 Hpt domain-containing protein [Pseudomonas sp. N040]
MGDWHDYVALEWVKGEISETLKQARQALEAYVENPQDLTRLRFCLTYVHQVHGTLQMVEFFGAALLAEEMEKLSQAMIDGRVSNQNEALEVMMQAVLQMPAYLERVQEARRDLPMIVLPLLNDLRAARGETLLSETSLFSPDLSSRPPSLPADALANRHGAEFPVLLRKLRQIQQQALVGVVRGQDLPANLGYMARVFARLESLCQGAPLGQLWQIAAGLTEGLANGSIANGASVRSLLRQVDRELKRLIEQGSLGINQAAPDVLVKNLLFYIAKSGAQSPRIKQLVELFRLNEALPDQGLVADERARLGGPDRDAMRSVVAALCEELVRVKDSLDLFVRSDRSRIAELEALLAPLKQIGDTLAVLGFGQPRKVILDQLDLLKEMSLGEQQPTDALLMDIAGALLYVEATLAGMAGPADVARGEESLMPTTDVSQIHQVVIKEARNGLEQAKDAIVEFIASQWDHQHLERVPNLLSQVRGGLAMIPLPRAAALLGVATQYIQEQLLFRKMVPNWQSLDTLADAITGLEYYLERISEDRTDQGEQILDVAEDSLEALGYSLKDKSLPEQLPEPAASPFLSAIDPLQEIDVLAVAPAEDDGATQDLSLSLPDELAWPGDSLDEGAELSGAQMEITDIQAEQPEEAAELPVMEASWADEELEVEAWADSGADAVLPADYLQPLEAGDLEELSAGELEPSLTQSAGNEIAEAGLSDVALSTVAEIAPEKMAEPTLSVADVMATPVAAINPPAQDVPQSLLPPPSDEEPLDEDLLEVFIEEAGEVLETIAEYLPKWFADTADKSALSEVRRAFHTLKGSGRMVRALIIGELSWSIENLLNRVLDRSIEADLDVQQVITDVVALLPELVEEFAAKQQRQRADVDQLAARAHALAKGLKLAVPEPETRAEAEFEQIALTEPEAEHAQGERLDAQLLEIFRNEADTHLETLHAFLQDCANELPQPVTDDLQRALHTLKGSAYMAGIQSIAEIAAPLEKLAKEYKAHQLDFDLAETELLLQATDLLRRGLAQLDSTPTLPVTGSSEFIQRIQLLQEERLAAEASLLEEEGLTRDPQLISIFLAQGMDILLDAEGLLKRWRNHPAEQQELTALLDELNTLGRGAQMAELSQIDALCQSLLGCYAAVQSGRLPVSTGFFDQVEAAHEALISMMDQVAAGLEVTPRNEQVEALDALTSQLPDDQPLSLQAAESVEMTDVIDFFDASSAELVEPEAEFSPAPSPPHQAVYQEPAASIAADDLEELDEDMVEIFLEEAIELVESSSHSLEKWLGDTANTQALAALLRDLHTLKGGARMARVRPVGDLAHELETLYEGLVDGRYRPSAELEGLLHQGHDLLAVLIEQMQGGQSLGNPAELIIALSNFCRGTGSATKGQQSEFSADHESAALEARQADSELMTASPAQDESASMAAVEVQTGELSPATEVIDLLPLPADVLPDAPQLDEYLDAAEMADPELVEIFLEEGFEIVDSAAASLHNWIANVNNSLELESLQRDLHTLKGGARMAEIRQVGDLAHELEFLYEGLGAGNLRPGPELFALLQRCHDCLAEMLDAVRNRHVMPDGDALIDAIKRLRADPQAQQSIPPSVHVQALEPVPSAPAAVPVNTDTDTDILKIFLEEADGLMEAMALAIGRWGAVPDDTTQLDELRRTLTTLKGGARLAVQPRLGDLAQDLEQYLSEIQQQGTPWAEPQLADVQAAFSSLQAELERLRETVTQGAESTSGQSPAVTELHSSRSVKFDQPIIAVSHRSAPTAKQARVLPFVQRAAKAAQEAESNRAPQELVKVPAELLEGLVNLAGETSIFRGRVEQQVSDVGYTLGEMEATIERVRDQLRRLDTETQAQILSRYQSETERSGYEEFDLLEMDRHSQLQQLSRALFESASDLLDLKETLAVKNRDAETLLLQQARVNTELQEGLMRTRMVPFDRLVPRLRRIVRQVSGELGKQVEFNVGNAEGEMDRTVLERIVAPLEHMLRNAVDHGIEPAATRIANGKPEVGTISLSLGREGGEILLILADDGGGIKLEAVRRKAIDRGMMAADSDLSDQEILQFILEAGFSTAEKVTQISGRGVGMDVVYSEVKQLGGSMRIESVEGKGTRFLIRLPFTVSVNRALMVLSGEDLYAIPLNTIEGIVRVSPFELEALYQREEGKTEAPRFEYAGQAYELKYLGDLLANGQQPKLVGQTLPLPVILVRSDEHTMAVQVDSLAGSREIVVKSMGRQFAAVHGISGATILGDGRVVVILDLLATIRSLHTQHQLLLPRTQGQMLLQAETDLARPTLVMVVDDSVTVRKVTTRLLERAGMNSLTAKDGIDALTQLQEHRPDIILLDVEMPRMDGFEVATLVRHDERLKDLPIIMITSRTGEKHRQRALAIGVNEYLGKPYQEAQLLETINRLVKEHD